jgi:hypothetical protein
MGSSEGLSREPILASAIPVPAPQWVDLARNTLERSRLVLDAGLPAVMVTDTAFFRNPNYHLPSDTIDTLNFSFMAELVKSLELALHALPPARQRWKPDHRR